MAALDTRNPKSNNASGYTLIAIFVVVIAVIIYIAVRFRNHFRLRSLLLHTRLQTDRGGPETAPVVAVPQAVQRVGVGLDTRGGGERRVASGGRPVGLERSVSSESERTLVS